MLVDLVGTIKNGAKVVPQRRQLFMEDLEDWIRSSLIVFVANPQGRCEKKVTINHEGVKVKKFLTRGTPQGGVLSPIAWNIAFESLLHIFSKGQVKICGFADDACLITTG